MSRRSRFTLGTAAVLLFATLLAAPASADPNPPVETYDISPNMEPLGASPRSVGVFNSDLAFWGDRAYQGTYDGFRIIDISNPEDPVSLIDYDECDGNQGDVIVWDDILVRSWNSSATGATCDGEALPPSFEGLNIFDVSDPSDPDLVSTIPLPGCGSHTATGVPDPANGRLLVYNGASSSACPIQIVEVPFANPALSMLLPMPTSAGRSCHDISVILGDAQLLTCAGGNGFTVFSLGGDGGGSLEMPLQLYSESISGVSIGHTASYSWDGEILVFGHEPGGGGQARCQESSAEIDKTLFFYDADTGVEVGRWVHERPQASSENCTIHNFNVVPQVDRNILVSGNYQAGIAVVDFTDPADAHEIAYADPAPLEPTQLGGDWSSYWYDGFIYESDITRGLITWRLNDERVDGARILGHLNPQTMEDTLELIEEGVPTKVAGGGQVPGAGMIGSATFGFNAKESPGGAKGNISVVDHSTGQHITSVSIQDVRLLESGETRVRGTCSIDDGPAEECEVVAFDGGEPGAGVDRFTITVGDTFGPGDPTYEAGGIITSGNVQQH